MTTEVRSIQTHYAGCYFRSRLEARWAKFFTSAGIEWEYEPQGYEVSKRISGGYDFATNEASTFRYLPDFWLPNHRVHVEVKGSLTPEETVRLYDAAASLSSNNAGGCHDSGGHDLILVGPLTANSRYANPVLLHMHKGDLEATCFWCGPHALRYVTVAKDDGTVDHGLTKKLLAGFACEAHNHVYGDAIDAARRARFEFGRRG